MAAVGILDDVIIYSEDPVLHVQHVRPILHILRDNKHYAEVENANLTRET